MAFTTYRALLTSYLDALADRNIDKWFYQSIENSREMRTTYYTLGSLTKFIEWLEMKAADEEAGGETGVIPFSIGGSY